MFRKRWQVVTVLNGREVYPVPEHHKFLTYKGAYRYANGLHRARSRAELPLENLDYLVHPIIRIEDMP